MKDSLKMPNKIKIGKIINTFGLKGEIKIYPYIDYFEDLDFIILDNNKFKIEKSRYQKNIVIAKLENIDTIEQAEDLKEKDIFIYEDMKPDLPEGTYYIDDLIGFKVVTDEGKVLGNLTNIYNTGANDIYEIDNNILLPAIKDVIKQIDLDNKQINVHIIEGLDEI